LYHQPTTYPGARLPHAWLNTAAQSKLVSTIDLAGHGHFTLLTGIGGGQWKTACDQVLAKMGVPIKYTQSGSDKILRIYILIGKSFAKSRRAAAS
jgi:hypothetical protein